MDKVEDVASVVGELAKVEALAEEILANKQQVVDLDRRRQSTREALRATIKSQSSPSVHPNHVDKSWICLGNMFMKLPTKQVKSMLEEDQKRLGEEIDKIRSGLKVKVASLREMQGQPELKGFDLHPMESEELFTATGHHKQFS